MTIVRPGVATVFTIFTIVPSAASLSGLTPMIPEPDRVPHPQRLRPRGREIGRPRSIVFVHGRSVRGDAQSWVDARVTASRSGRILPECGLTILIAAGAPEQNWAVGLVRIAGLMHDLAA